MHVATNTVPKFFEDDAPTHSSGLSPFGLDEATGVSILASPPPDLDDVTAARLASELASQDSMVRA